MCIRDRSKVDPSKGSDDCAGPSFCHHVMQHGDPMWQWLCAHAFCACLCVCTWSWRALLTDEIHGTSCNHCKDRVQLIACGDSLVPMWCHLWLCCSMWVPLLCHVWSCAWKSCAKCDHGIHKLWHMWSWVCRDRAMCAHVVPYELRLIWILLPLGHQAIQKVISLRFLF